MEEPDFDYQKDSQRDITVSTGVVSRKQWGRYLQVIYTQVHGAITGDLKPGCSCHDVCEYTVKKRGEELRLRYARGYYYVSWEHSWLVMQDNNGQDESAIIDCYPVAGGFAPVLLSTILGSPARSLFREDRQAELKETFRELLSHIGRNHMEWGSNPTTRALVEKLDDMVSR